MFYVIDTSNNKLTITGYPTQAGAEAAAPEVDDTRKIVGNAADLRDQTDEWLDEVYMFKSPDKVPMPPADRADKLAAVGALLWPPAKSAASPAVRAKSTSKRKPKRELTNPPEAPTPSVGGDPATDKETVMENVSTENTAPVARKSGKAKAAPKKKAAVKAKGKNKNGRKDGGPSTPRGDLTIKIGALLCRAKGATRKDILALTGWKAVSVQAQAKACGLKLKVEKEPGSPMVYFGKK